MLFRIWQHALMDQPMTVQEMWHWVHVCYGEELGLTSDDEDYVQSTLDENKISKLASEDFFEESTQALRKVVDGKEMTAEPLPSIVSEDRFHSDSSDATESDEDKVQSTVAEDRPLAVPSTCPNKHEGKMMLNEVYPLGIDEVFTLLFTYNKFNMEVMDAMKYTDVDCAKWEEDPTTGMKKRITHLIAPVGQAVGPKNCQVTETQVMKASKPGELYVVEVETTNGGVPYCDSFYVSTHLCLTRASRSETAFTVCSQIKYRKSVWGIVKNFIEKNVWAGLEDFYKCLGKCLEEECIRRQSESGLEVTRIRKRENTRVISSVVPTMPVTAVTRPSTVPAVNNNELVLWAIMATLTILLILNAFLFYKLAAIENFDGEPTLANVIDARIFSEERSHEQWLSLLQKQAIQHHKEIQKWKTALKSIVSHIKQAEESISNLQNNIQSAVSERVMAVLNPAADPDGVSLNSNRNEL